MSHFLMPVLALIFWSLIIWCIMYARRIPAMQKARIAPDTARSPDGEWKSKLPERAQFAAHNYNHLMEQPTIFYALMFAAVLMEATTSLTLYFAWGYVALRVAHSLVQISSNKVMLRFGLFTLSTLALITMTVITALQVL